MRIPGTIIYSRNAVVVVVDIACSGENIVSFASRVWCRRGGGRRQSRERGDRRSRDKN